MKELQTILTESARLKAENVRAVLATVVDVKGSGYRLPGAKMLIAESGEIFGTVSGGCLESDVLEQARKVLETGEPTILTYDTTANRESVFSLNMGCNGVTRILLEAAENNKYFEFVESCFQAETSGVVATLIAGNGETCLKIGARYFFSNEQEISSDLPVDFKESLSADVSDLLAAGGRSHCRTFETEESATAEFFLELVAPPQNLLVFGAGYDAIPVVNFARNLGWKITIVDHRAAFAARTRFPGADRIVLTQPENLAENLSIGKNAAAVVMTHNYEKDREILQFLLGQKSLAYVGALGPKSRTEKLLEELREQLDEDFSRFDLEKLFAPVGLDIGADNPEAIALSIIAEIQSVLGNRAGGFLRARQGSIYGR